MHILYIIYIYAKRKKSHCRKLPVNLDNLQTNKMCVARPYKATTIHKSWCKTAFCELVGTFTWWMMDKQTSNLFYFISEARLQLKWHINNQHTGLQTLIQKLPLHIRRVVCGVLWAQLWLLDPFFFSKTIHSSQYVSCILTRFLEPLFDYKGTYSFFQLVKAFAHTANNPASFYVSTI
jgi:hypothetical protein